MLAGPFDMPEETPKPPESPIIKFLNKDIWKVYFLARQCVGEEYASFCVDAKTNSLMRNDFFISVAFTWKFSI